MWKRFVPTASAELQKIAISQEYEIGLVRFVLFTRWTVTVSFLSIAIKEDQK